MIYYTSTSTPFGVMGLAATDAGIDRVFFPEEISFEKSLQKRHPGETIKEQATPILKKAVEELEKYFKGELKEFSVPLDLKAPPFYKIALNAVNQVPYGTTVSYKDIAVKVGNPAATRAVGSANANNPIPIIIPCHRILAHNGDLGGYGGNLQRKAFLLELEGVL